MDYTPTPEFTFICSFQS